MKSTSRVQPLNARGIAHFFVPLLIIMAVAIGGTYFLVSSHADSLNMSLPLEAEQAFTASPYNPQSLNKFAVATDSTASGQSAFISKHSDVNPAYTGYENAGLVSKFSQTQLIGSQIQSYTLRAKITNCPNDPLQYVFTRPHHHIGTQDYVEWKDNKLSLPAASTQSSYVDYNVVFLPLNTGGKAFYIPTDTSPLEMDLGVGYTNGTKSTDCVSGVSIDKITLNYLKDVPASGVTSGPVTQPSADTIPPTVKIAQPGNGQAVRDGVQVVAEARDNVRVSHVRFMIDNIVRNDIGTNTPYPAYYWNTRDVPNGKHLISVVAFDDAGHATSANITVNVMNPLNPASTVVIEGENTATTTNPYVGNDPAASGGKYRAMYRSGTISSKFTTNGFLHTVNIRARATACTTTPKMEVTIDGQQVFGTVVQAPSWQNYTFGVPANQDPNQSLTHNVVVTFPNDSYIPKKCDANLFIDSIKFN